MLAHRPLAKPVLPVTTIGTCTVNSSEVTPSDKMSVTSTSLLEAEMFIEPVEAPVVVTVVPSVVTVVVSGTALPIVIVPPT